MRRIWILLALLLCVAMPAVAMDMGKVTGQILAVVMEKSPSEMGELEGLFEEGSWVSARFKMQDERFVKWLCVVYDAENEAVITWDDLFVDADAAAAHIEALAAAAMADNAYAEYKEVAPVPRENFMIREDQLYIYYPPTQLSYFSGHAGVMAFYAYELDGLLKEGVPLAKGDAAAAKAALSEALETHTLPGVWVAVGDAMRLADSSFVLVDVPDYKDDYAVWHFEAPQMRGAALLSSREDDRVDTATITGIHTERVDFDGLQTGVSTMADCLAALGEPQTRTTNTAENAAYALIPDGQSLCWQQGGYTLSLNFVEDILHSITLVKD